MRILDLTNAYEAKQDEVVVCGVFKFFTNEDFKSFDKVIMNETQAQEYENDKIEVLSSKETQEAKNGKTRNTNG